MSAALWLLVALAAPPKIAPKLDPPPKVEVPKVDLGPSAVPKPEGLSGPTRPDEPRLRQSPSDRQPSDPAQAGLAPRLESLEHARDFTRGAQGYKAVGRIDSWRVEGVPATLGPFKTLLRLVSPGRAGTLVKVRLRGPGGEDLLASSAEIEFSAGEVMELVIDWDAFPASRLGDYKMIVDVGGVVSEHALPVKAK